MVKCDFWAHLDRTMVRKLARSTTMRGLVSAQTHLAVAAWLGAVVCTVAASFCTTLLTIPASYYVRLLVLVCDYYIVRYNSVRVIGYVKTFLTNFYSIDNGHQHHRYRLQVKINIYIQEYWLESYEIKNRIQH